MHKLKRVAIVDFDAHHGNATQNAFAHNPNILYISLHRYDHSKFYPCSHEAGPHNVGIGTGKGRNINIGWNTTPNVKVGNADYIHAFEQIVIPTLAEFQPELIIVSAGFDCAKGDPLGGLDVTPACFNHMITELMLVTGKIVVALEGGYNVNATAQSMAACLRGLLGEVIPVEPGTPTQCGIDAVKETIMYHKPYWNYFGVH